MSQSQQYRIHTWAVMVLALIAWRLFVKQGAGSNRQGGRIVPRDTRGHLADASKQVGATNDSLRTLTTAGAGDLRPMFDKYVENVRKTQAMADRRAQPRRGDARQHRRVHRAVAEGAEHDQRRGARAARASNAPPPPRPSSSASAAPRRRSRPPTRLPAGPAGRAAIPDERPDGRRGAVDQDPRPTTRSARARRSNSASPPSRRSWTRSRASGPRISGSRRHEGADAHVAGVRSWCVVVVASRGIVIGELDKGEAS